MSRYKPSSKILRPGAPPPFEELSAGQQRRALHRVQAKIIEDLRHTRATLASVQAQRNEDINALAGVAAYLAGALEALPPEVKAQAEAEGARQLGEIVQAQAEAPSNLAIELINAAAQALAAHAEQLRAQAEAEKGGA